MISGFSLELMIPFKLFQMTAKAGTAELIASPKRGSYLCSRA